MPEVTQERYDEAVMQIFKSEDYSSPCGMLGVFTSMQTKYTEAQSHAIMDIMESIKIDVRMLVAKAESVKFHSLERVYAVYNQIVEGYQQRDVGMEQRDHSILMEIS